MSSTSLTSIISILNSSKPTFRSAHDVAIFTVHLVAREQGFRCVGIDENKEEGKEMGIVPTGWNASSDTFTFVYTHPTYPSIERVVIKGLPIGNKLMLYGLKKSQSDKVETIEMNVDDYINKDSLTDYNKLYRDGSGLLSLIDRFLTPLSPTSKTTEIPSNPPLHQPPSSYDPLRVPTRQPRHGFPRGGGDLDGDGELAHPHFDPFNVGRMGGGGDFARDLDPFGGTGGGWGTSVGGLGGGVGPGMGPPLGMPGGNLFGPERFRDPHRDFVSGGPPLGGGARPRFDPFGPVPGVGQEPQPDHLRPEGTGAFPFDYTIQSHTQPATSVSRFSAHHPPASSSISSTATSAATPSSSSSSSSTSSSSSLSSSSSTSTPLTFSSDFNQDIDYIS